MLPYDGHATASMLGTSLDAVFTIDERGISSFVQEGRRYFTGFVRDMTERQQSEDRMRVLATHAQASPGRLVVELTESVVAHDIGLVNARMREIKALGAAISLDDFGTGYSSLAYLRHFPIVSMAKALSLGTIAEGIENELQARLLGELGVDQCQGYLFGHPLPPAEFLRMVSAQERHATAVMD